MAAAVIAVGLLGCQAPGISRDQAITLAVRQIGPSTGPLALVSAVRQPASEAGSGSEWVVTFTGTFQGEGIEDLVRELKTRFQTVKTIKPKASRSESREIYLLARSLGM